MNFQNQLRKLQKIYIFLKIFKIFDFLTQKLIEFFEGVSGYLKTSNLHNLLIYIENKIPESFKWIGQSQRPLRRDFVDIGTNWRLSSAYAA